MQVSKFSKTVIAAIVVVIGVAIIQTMSMMSVQSVAAEPVNNQGQCLKSVQSDGATQQEAHEVCTNLESIFNQGQCIQAVREYPELFEETEEGCKGFHSPPPKFSE